MSTPSPQTCFTIELAKPSPLPKTRRPITGFIRKVHEGGVVERVGRLDMIDVPSPTPSSLFFHALHASFAKHYPFALRPEVVMSMVNFTIAETVRRHPGDYRHLFTKSKWNDTRKAAPPQEHIEVIHNGLVKGDPESPWHEVFPLFNAELRKRVPAGVMDHMLPQLSTATIESDAAQMTMFMDAASPFYTYGLTTLCGVPAVRLLGTATDWERLLSSVSMLSEAFSQHLKPYFDALLPVLRRLALQAGGEAPNQAFWSSIYKSRDESGGPQFSGWSSAFVNYVQYTGQRGLTERRGDRNWLQERLMSDSVPAQLGSAPFVWTYLGTKVPMRFVGGVLAIEEHDGFLTPELSYAVMEAQPRRGL